MKFGLHSAPNIYAMFISEDPIYSLCILLFISTHMFQKADFAAHKF